MWRDRPASFAACKSRSKAFLDDPHKNCRPWKAGLRYARLLRLKPEPELQPSSANTIIKAQEFHPRHNGTHGQYRRQVNRVKSADGFSGKRMPRSVDNVRTDSPQVPVGGGRIQVRASIGGRGFLDFSERDGANQHAIALDEGKIGGHHQFGMAEHRAHGAAGFFPEQPR